MRGEALLGRDVVALDELLVDGLARDLGVALADQVLCLHVRHVALVARDVLGLDVVRGAAHPVRAFLRDISYWQFLCFFVLLGRPRVESSLRQAGGLVSVVDV